MWALALPSLNLALPSSEEAPSPRLAMPISGPYFTWALARQNDIILIVNDYMTG
jgi:hypothetical protein